MNRIPLTCLLVLLTVSPAFAGPEATPAPETKGPAAPSVFIDTDPMGARINLDGVLLPDRTPVLLRGLHPGKHTVIIRQPGYLDAVQDITVSEKTVPVLTLGLTPDSMVLAYPDNQFLDDGQSLQETSGLQFRTPAGTYILGSKDGKARVVPAFPDGDLLAVAGWSLAIISGAALASSLSDGYHMSAGWTDHPSTLTAALWGTALFELPWYFSLTGRKARWEKTEAPLVTAQAENLDQVKYVWDQGEDALQTGDLDRALGVFTRVIREHPGSRLVPGAWFRVARLHAVSGRRDLAMGEYQLVAGTYPQAEYHDKARKALADLYEAAGNPQLALENLRAMVLTDGFFDKADIDAQISRLTALLEARHAP